MKEINYFIHGQPVKSPNTKPIELLTYIHFDPTTEKFTNPYYVSRPIESAESINHIAKNFNESGLDLISVVFTKKAAPSYYLGRWNSGQINLKPIEFTCYLSSNRSFHADVNSFKIYSKYDLISRNYTDGQDLILGFQESRDAINSVLFIGKWNDGFIKQ